MTAGCETSAIITARACLLHLAYWRRLLAAAGGVTGALALLSIDPAVAASSLLGAVAALGGVLPRPL